MFIYAALLYKLLYMSLDKLERGTQQA